MQPLLFIRKTVFGLTQQEMAEVAGARQATISRWERGELEPDRDQMGRIRDEAARRGIEWKDEWFFEQQTDGDDKPSEQQASA